MAGSDTKRSTFDNTKTMRPGEGSCTHYSATAEFMGMVKIVNI
jgi:hypothetical protein